VHQEKYPKPAKPPARKEPEEELTPDPTVDDFLNRMKGDLHRPKPDQQAIAAALHAMQRLTAETDSQDSVDLGMEAEGTLGTSCHACGGVNPGGHRFCSTCGVPLEDLQHMAMSVPQVAPRKRDAYAAGQHHFHHHYHHHYFNSDGTQASVPERRSAAPAPVAGNDPSRARSSLAATSLGRVEVAARKVSQDWVSACNTKNLDDLVDLYLADAIVLRPNVPPIRGTSSIREFFFSVLDAGLGEVELESLRVELVGDVAYEAGRCKMLVPVAMGKRREERGKYLIVLTRQAGEWKIASDCWSSDLSLAAGPEPGAAKANLPSSSPRSRQ
jgi:ketosteroid isomerase-like protein